MCRCRGWEVESGVERENGDKSEEKNSEVDWELLLNDTATMKLYAELFVFSVR